MENTAKNFVLQLGSLFALYVSVASLLSLLFAIITVAFPDAADTYYQYDASASQIRFSIATLVVFFPTYLYLTRLVNTIRRTEHGMYLTLTKWLIYISLLIGGCVILGDLVSIIYTFLNGDIAIRFTLKALSVLVVVGLAFFYYLFDARGYWQSHEKKSIEYGALATVLVVGILVVGFFHTETPAAVREMKIDDTQITDLQDIQWRIEDYYRLNQELPSTIDEVYSGLQAPKASAERTPYSYTVLDVSSFELCAEFSHESSGNGIYSGARPILEPGTIKNPDNWDHGTGTWCFKRVLAE